MTDQPILEELRRIVGPDHVSIGAAASEVYSYDASLATGAPAAVVFPADTAQVAAVLKAASAERIPCTPRGFGTNLSGGSVPLMGGLIVCLTRLNSILDIQPARRCAVAQAGVTNLELQNALAPSGFFYAPDPASQKVATLGGNVGENAGGPHCVKYGVTENHVLGLEVVLYGGEVLQIGGPALDPPGLDLAGILIGSEGTLGIVTTLTLRILPMPESVATLLAVYDDISDAARSVSDIVAAGIAPATLEMMDAPIIRAVEESFPCGYPLDAAAVLIIEVDGPRAGLKAQADRIQDLCRTNRCRDVRIAKDAAERNLLWAGRRGAFGAIARLAPNYLVSDCTVPRTLLPDALAQVAEIAARYRLAHANVFHAGDGNLHPLFLFDSRDEGQLQRVHEAGWEVMKACAALGGTITGEHGIGAAKIEAMRMVFSEDDLDAQRALRAVFDPAGLLNPGKVIPPPKPAPAAVRVPAREPASDRRLAPSSAGEVCEIVRWAASRQVALLPLGGGRRADAGNSPAGPEMPLRSDKLSAIVEHDPSNQVVTVGAGLRLSALQEALAKHDQWLPLRPPLLDGCTLGGVVALGACGPERLLYGAPRDLVLGLRFVSGKGRLITAGGRVVKNVAGYDLLRLIVGSAGTLGFVTEVTFRVAAMPEACAEVSAAGPLQQCASAAAELLRSALALSLVAATPNAAAGGPAWRLAVGFEGFGETVNDQVEKCAALFAKHALSERRRRDYSVRDGVFGAAFESLCRGNFLVRADLPLDGVTEFAILAAERHPAQQMLLDFGCGRVLASLPNLPEDAWTRLCALARRLEGHARLERAPDEFKKRHDVFGPPRADWPLAHRLKDALDPRNVFAPGRMPGRK